jgi:hypothetical protein
MQKSPETKLGTTDSARDYSLCQSAPNNLRFEFAVHGDYNLQDLARHQAENDIPISSSRMGTESPLAPKRSSNVFDVGYQPKRLRPEQARLLLTECANLSEDAGAMVRFKQILERKLTVQFADLFPEVNLNEERYETVEALAHSEASAIPEGAINKDFFGPLRNGLRRIWEAPNPRHKELLLLGLRDYVNGLRKPLHERAFRLIPVAFWGTPQDPQEPTPLEQGLIYLFKSVDKVRCCPTLECPARYFFAERRNQRYCSEQCAQIAEREQKREWWDAHGKKDRRDRRAEKQKERASSDPRAARPRVRRRLRDPD